MLDNNARLWVKLETILMHQEEAESVTNTTLTMFQTVHNVPAGVRVEQNKLGRIPAQSK